MNVHQLQNSLELNLGRVKNLIALYDGIVANNLHAVELLRAAVVFLHATLEDFLRSVARGLLPFSDRRFLDEIPFFAVEDRKTTITLGKLSERYPGHLVEEVVQLSIDEYLSRATYNNMDEIAGLFKRIGLEKNSLDRHGSSLKGLMARRHNIAHRFDRKADDSSEPGHAIPIERQDVVDWMASVESFLLDVLASLSSRRET